MQDVSEKELLRRYAKDGSNEAFAKLAARHVNLVYSVALRKTGDVHAAEEITQAVFIILARKAHSLDRHTIVSGWLYQTTRLTAANFLRTEIRRACREQEAYMQSSTHETETETWQHIAPLLENAMGDLGEKDRNAIVLRFFEGKSFQEIGLAFGASENAAKKRVHYALEKLRKFFGKRGVTLSATVIAGVISANSVHAAPSGLIAATTAAIGTAAKSGAAATLAQGTVKLMTWAKIKMAIGLSSALILATAAATIALKPPSARDIVAKSREKYASLSSYRDRTTVRIEGYGLDANLTCHFQLQRNGLCQMDWSDTMNTNTGAVEWSEGDSEDSLQRVKDLASSRGFPAAAGNILFSFFPPGRNNDWLQIRPEAALRLGKNETVAGVDCWVLSRGSLPDGTDQIKLWIGRNDYLFHKMQYASGSLRAALLSLRTDRPVDNPEIKAQNEKMKNAAIHSTEKIMRMTRTELHDDIVVEEKSGSANISSADPWLIVPGESVGKIRKGMTVQQVEAELGKPSQFLFGKKMVYENSKFGSVMVNEKTGVSVLICDGPFLQKTGVKFSTGRQQKNITSVTTIAQLIAELGRPTSYSQVNGDRQNFTWDNGLQIIMKKDKVLSINVLFPK